MATLALGSHDRERVAERHLGTRIGASRSSGAFATTAISIGQVTATPDDLWVVTPTP